MGSEVLTSGDVYGYGILLLEMFTRKKPTDNTFSESLSLYKFAKVEFPKEVASIANPTLFHITCIRPTHPPATLTAAYDLRVRCQDLKSTTLHKR